MRKKQLRKRQDNHRHHCLKRFRQRYGIEFTDEDYAKLYRAIRDQHKQVKVEGVDIEFIGRQSLSRTLYRIKYKNIDAVVVYNSITKRIATVLPQGARIPSLHSLNTKFEVKD